MFSQMTLAYVRFLTWDWHIRLIMFWKINCWFCRIKTRAITGLLWRRTLKRLATYHWLTPTCSIPIAWFRISLFKRGTVLFCYLLLLLVLPRLIIIIWLISVLLFYAFWIEPWNFWCDASHIVQTLSADRSSVDFKINTMYG